MTLPFLQLANDLRNADLCQQILAKTQQSATLPPSANLVQQMPLKPTVFHGRDTIIEEISQLLIKEETSRVCVLGAFGMGKTSVSLGVVEQPLIKSRFPPENIIWVPCIEATSATLLLGILCTQLQVPGYIGQPTIEKIMSLLATSTEPHLILLDNFETPYNAPGAQKQVEDTLRQIAMLSHIAILVTMRGRSPPCDEAIKWQSKEIQPTDEGACLRIYRSIYPDSENDPDVGRLLAILGHMPFAVTQMARLAKEGQSRAKELIEAWSESGPDILSGHHEQSVNRSISLSIDSNLMKQNPQALLLLNVLSYLPAGTTKAALRWWVPALDSSMVTSAIVTLSKTGLLVENQRQQDSDRDSPVLFVHPVVQSFMQQHGRIGEEIRQNIQLSCSQYVLDHYHQNRVSKVKALAAEDDNIKAILFGSHTTQHNNKLSDKAIEALIAFSWYRCNDAKPDVEIAKHAVSMAKVFGNKKYIASSLWCLGMTYGHFDEYHAAYYDHVQEGYQLYNSLLPGDRELQRLCCQCGFDMVNGALLTFDDCDNVVSLARDVEKQAATISDDDIHAKSLVMLGRVMDNSGHRPEALHHLERAKLKRIASGTLSSDVYYLIALVHYNENRLSEALDAAEEAWKLSEPRNNLVDHSQNAFILGVILFSANRDIEAWKYMEISLTKNLELGNRRDTAITLEYMGYGYLRRGDYLNAYDAYKAAAESYLGTVDEKPYCTKCKDNMAKIEDMQKNPDLDVGFQRPRNHRNWPSLFYPSSADTL